MARNASKLSGGANSGSGRSPYSPQRRKAIIQTLRTAGRIDAADIARALLTTPDPAEAAIKRLMLHSAQRKVLLADRSKVGHLSVCKHGDIADIDLLITDTGLTPVELTALEAAGLTVEQT